MEVLGHRGWFACRKGIRQFTVKLLTVPFFRRFIRALARSRFRFDMFSHNLSPVRGLTGEQPDPQKCSHFAHVQHEQPSASARIF